MLKVGITGGIGSGKSLVCQLLSFMGVPILDSDQLAKEIMVRDTRVVEGIKALFGTDAYDSDGQINRELLSARIFQDASLLEQLNQLVHPAVGQATQLWFDIVSEKPYAVKEAALIYETKAHLKLDYVIGVVASESTRMERVMKRSGLTDDRIRSIMKNQPFANRLEEMADFIIHNDGDQSLILQVVNLHQQLLEISNQGMHSKGHPEEE